MAETDDNKDNQNQTEGDKNNSNQKDVKAAGTDESDITISKNASNIYIATDDEEDGAS